MDGAFLSMLEILFQPTSLLALFVGILVGMMLGAAPGMGLSGFIVLLGFVHHFEPTTAVLLAIGILVPQQTMDAIPAVLFGIPGSVSGQALIMDGPQLARQGRGGEALGANYMASAMGGLFGVAVLVASFPFVRPVVRQLGSSEFFLISLLGIGVVAVISRGSVPKGLLSGAAGFMVGLIGLDPLYGTERLTFGQPFLFDGIGIIPVVIGLFAIPELAMLVINKRPISHVDKGSKESYGYRAVLRGARQSLAHQSLVLRSSAVGAAVGAMPGIGSSVVDWLVYVQAKLSVPGGEKTFGKGDIRGVIAPGSADNSMFGASLIPTLAFGIPGSLTMAVFIGMMVLIGYRPGPVMVAENLNILYLIIVAVGLASVVSAVLGGLVTPLAVRLTRIEPDRLVPVILGLLFAISFNTGVTDFVVVAVISILGLAMRVWGWARPPFLIAFVLSAPIDQYGRRTLSTYGAEAFQRPQLWIVILVVVLVVAVGMLTQRRLRRAEAVMGDGGEPQGDEGLSASPAEAQAEQGDRSSSWEAGEASTIAVVAPDARDDVSDPSRRQEVILVGGLVVRILAVPLVSIWLIVHGRTMMRDAGYALVFAGVLGVLAAIPYAWSAYRRFLRRRAGLLEERASIADLGFDLEVPQRIAVQRGARVVGGLIAMIIGTVLVGIHVTVPIFIVTYLIRWGGTNSRATILWAGLGTLFVIGGFFDSLLLTPWPQSILEQAVDLHFGRVLREIIPW